MNNTSNHSNTRTRVASIIALLNAAAWSVCLLFIAARTNRSVVLKGLFAFWGSFPVCGTCNN